MKTSLTLIFLLSGSISSAVDWSRCADSLADLKTKVENASQASRAVETAEEEVTEAKDSLRLCRSYSEGNCKFKEGELEDAQDTYRRKVGDFQSELSSVTISEEVSVSASCRAEVPALADCLALRRFRSRAKKEVLDSLCSSLMSPENCRKCLEI